MRVAAATVEGDAQLRREAISMSQSRLPMLLILEIEREDDGRWLAEVPTLAGAVAYGATRDEAISRVEALALRVLADRLENGEAGPDIGNVSFKAA